MDLALVCVPPAILLVAWGFGSLMQNIAKVRGRNPHRGFRVGFISYAALLLMIIITYLISSFSGGGDSPDITSTLFLTVLIILGFLSPLGILFLRRKHP